MLRSTIAVFSGVLAWGVLWVVGNTGLQALFPGSFREDLTTDVPALLGTTMGFSVLLSLLAGHLCSRIAGRRPLTHATVLGLVQLAIGIGVQASVWSLMPLLYHLGFLALVVPGHVVGGGLAAPVGIQRL